LRWCSLDFASPSDYLATGRGIIVLLFGAGLILLGPAFHLVEPSLALHLAITHEIAHALLDSSSEMGSLAFEIVSHADLL
jgi:hypothetical protein